MRIDRIIEEAEQEFIDAEERLKEHDNMKAEE